MKRTKGQQVNTLFNNNHIVIDDIVRNTKVLIAEGEILTRAQRMVAKEYSLFMPPEKRSEQVAFSDLCDEDLNQKINTYVLLYKDPVSHTDNILATLRIAFGDTDRKPPLEAMELIDVVDSHTHTHKWPHEDMGIEIANVCEIGRFLLSRSIIDDEIKYILASKLLKFVYDNVRLKKAQLMISIMPEYVYKFALRSGTTLHKVDCKINSKDTEKAKQTRKRYPIYWQKLKPALYIVDLFSYEK